MEPLADVITLLRPRAVGTKVIHGAGRWAVRRSRVAYAGFGLLLIGQCWLAADGHKPVRLATGDFVLMPASRAFTIASERRVWSPSDLEYVPSALTPTDPVTAMMFPARTAREYPIFGSHFDPELAVIRPARSVTVMLMSLAMCLVAPSQKKLSRRS